MKLFDYIRVNGLPEPFLPGASKAIFVDGCPVIDASNISNYYFSGTEKEHWNLYEDFPNLAPPFKQFWIESSPPIEINSEVYGRQKFTAPVIKYGCLVTAHERAAVPGARWELEIMPILLGPGKLLHFVGCMMFPVSGTGNAMPYMDKPGPVRFMVTGSNDQEKEFSKGLVQSFTDPLLLAISFMHCKNVSVSQVPQDQPQVRKFQRQNGFKPCRTYVLEIKPMKKILESSGPRGSSLQYALHICRGHFKDYRQSGLFGKLPGMYWWDDQVRGKIENGKVEKEYSIAVPEAKT